MTEYIVRFGTPSIDDYRRLREVSGLTPRSIGAAAAGLPNTFIGALVEHHGRTVGMGRVVGDGALFLQIVDIAVDPDHQGRGVGKQIIGALLEELRRCVPAEAHVTLFADGEAHRLYAQFGFESTAPSSIGMAMWLR